MFSVMMAYFEPITDALNENCPHKRIVQPLKNTSGLFLLEAGFGKERASYTGTNSAKTDDLP